MPFLIGPPPSNMLQTPGWWSRPPAGLIFHSDRGSQYTSADFAALAAQHKVVLSVGRKGECWDNAVAESFFATIKRELIDTRPWPTKARLHRAIFEWTEGWYNTRRLHSALGYRTPAEADRDHHPAAADPARDRTPDALEHVAVRGSPAARRVRGDTWHRQR